MRKHTYSGLLVLLLMALVLSACSGGKVTVPQPQQPAQPAAVQPEQPRGPKQLTLGMWSSPNSFSPITNTTSYGAFVYYMIYQPLVVINDQLKFEGRLAESWEISPDQTRFTFHLNKQARWTDGTPVTADDVIANIEMIANPDTPTSRRSLIDTIKGVDQRGIAPDGKVAGARALDANTLEITTKAPVDIDAFLEKFGTGVYVVPKAVLDAVKNRKDIDKEPWVMDPRVTNGPFKFVRYVTDQYVELEKNKDYFLGEPKLDKVFVKVVGQAAFAAAIEKGEIDVAAGSGLGEVPVADWGRISALPNVSPVTYSASMFQMLDINAALPYLSDAKVRQGLAHAINRKQIVDRLLQGQGDIVNTPLTAINKYYVKELEDDLPYNPERARKLLSEGGWDYNREIVLLTPTGNLVREQSAEIIQANLQAIGVKVQIRKMDFTAMMATAKKGEYDLSLWGFGFGFDPDFSVLVSSSGVYNYRRLPGTENDNHKYVQKQMEELLVKGRVTTRFEDRLTIYAEAQKLFVQDLPFIPLYAPKALAAVNKRVVNAKPGPAMVTWNAYLWDVTK